MNEYKSVSKFLEKEKPRITSKNVIKKIMLKVLVCILFLLIGLIVLKTDKNNSKVIYKFIYEENLNFAKINELYQKYLGDILPFKSSNKKNVVPVFSEELKYKSLSVYKDGISLEVEDEYLIPILENGIVVFIGDKEEYGNTIIVQQTNGVNLWYGNVKNVNVDLYDYVSKGEFLAASNSKSLYLVFEKDGKFINYKEYF